MLTHTRDAYTGTPAAVELRNAQLDTVRISALTNDVGDPITFSTDDCSGSPEDSERCLRFGVEPVLRDMFVVDAPAIDAAVAAPFTSLRVGYD